jgi:hypothetical protein
VFATPAAGVKLRDGYVDTGRPSSGIAGNIDFAARIDGTFAAGVKFDAGALVPLFGGTHCLLASGVTGPGSNGAEGGVTPVAKAPAGRGKPTEPVAVTAMPSGRVGTTA